jgi:hypothetical protein
VLVYGDHPRAWAPEQLIRSIETSRTAAAGVEGLERGERLRRAFLDAAALAQGLADAEFDERGHDAPSSTQAASMALVIAIARELAANWRGQPADQAGVGECLRVLAQLRLPDRIVCKVPEGHAFYALYPETYFAAAGRYDWPGPPLLIGLRSIGAGLAGAVAAVTGANQVITLRPTGHPFRRTISASDELAELVRRHEGPIAIVDEGPGLSGSSFGAAADWLEGLGVTPERIVFMPSHSKQLGSEASPRHRARWARARRLTISFEDLWRDDPPAAWFADIVGRAFAVESLSAGAWRAGRNLPAQPEWERRKCRINAEGGCFLAKFAGLGEIGEAKFERARALHAAGFVGEPLALRRGFILWRWEEARTLMLAGEGRGQFLAHLGEYLGYRARAFPARPDQGASPAELVDMVRVNIGVLAPGDECHLSEVAADLRKASLTPVVVDARLHAWEWLVTSDGRIVKTDALDHAVSHDLVGCQDIAWDVAGAIVEFGLSTEEAAQLASRVGERAGRAVDPIALGAFEVCYAAFQAAAWTMAGQNPVQQVGLYLSRLR